MQPPNIFIHGMREENNSKKWGRFCSPCLKNLSKETFFLKIYKKNHLEKVSHANKTTPAKRYGHNADQQMKCHSLPRHRGRPAALKELSEYKTRNISDRFCLRKKPDIAAPLQAAPSLVKL
ncbi:hypothetical protein CEXT_671591 [Caerostris extrusa]|uniref:Uncharacterized protein n=1 Tax=Caerostris extrusa TaxID=172846 RepID=A0AAV4S099_CAEEX|nr:hypothetical protein CEXT_671591 [Caerostris extrusa]